MTEGERRDLEREARIQRVLRQRPRDLSTPPFTAVEARLRRRTPFPVILVTSAAAIVLALVLGNAVAERRAGTPDASPTPEASAVSAKASPREQGSPTPTASAPSSVLSDRFGFVWVDEPEGLKILSERGTTGLGVPAARPWGFSGCGCKVSPDGTRVLYWTSGTGSTPVELRIFNVHRPMEHPTIYTTQSERRISAAAWSNDGTGILFSEEGIAPPGSPVGNPPDPTLLVIEASGGEARTLHTNAGVYVPLGWDKSAGIAAAALSGEGGYMTGYLTVRTAGDPAPKLTVVRDSILVMSVDVSSDQRYALGVFFEQGQTGGAVRWWRFDNFAPVNGGPLVAAQFGARWRPGTAEIGWVEGDSLQLLDVESLRGRVVGNFPSTGYGLSAFRHDGSAAAVTNISRTLLVDLASGASEIISGPGYVAEAVRMPPPSPVPTGSTAEPGAMTGRFGYGSDHIPAVTVYAISTTDPSVWYSVDFAGLGNPPFPTAPPGTSGDTYTITGIAPGTYWVVAYQNNGDNPPYPGWYSRQVECFRNRPSGPCPDVTLVEVTAIPGQITTGIDLITWGPPPDPPSPTIPPRPTPR